MARQYNSHKKKKTKKLLNLPNAHTFWPTGRGRRLNQCFYRTHAAWLIEDSAHCRSACTDDQQWHTMSVWIWAANELLWTLQTSCTWWEASSTWHRHKFVYVPCRLLCLFILFIWFDAMTAYKQIMPRLTTSLTGMQKYNKIYTPLYTVHCDKLKKKT